MHYKIYAKICTNRKTILITFFINPLIIEAMKTIKLTTVNYGMDLLLINFLTDPCIPIETQELEETTRQIITFQNYKETEIDEIIYNFITANIQRALDELEHAGDDTYFDYLPAYMEQIAQVILLLRDSIQINAKTVEYAIKQFNRDLLSGYRRQDAWEGNMDEDLKIDDNIDKWAVYYEDEDLKITETLE